MKQKKNSNQEKDQKKSSTEENHDRPASTEKFNTGSHTPSSLRNVGPGYDDTGMSYEKSRETEGNDDLQNKKQEGQKNRKDE